MWWSRPKPIALPFVSSILSYSSQALQIFVSIFHKFIYTNKVTGSLNLLKNK